MVSIDYVLRDKLDTLNSTLKEILSLLRDSVPKEIVVNNVVTSQNEKDKPVYDFEVRSVFIDDTKSKKEIREKVLREAKRLEKEDIIYFDVSKALYKRQVGSGEYIKVAFITGDGKITFLARNEDVISSPGYYSSLWYYLNEVGELRYSTFDMVNVNQIYVDRSLEEGRYYVTGYIDDDGRAIYYDQYI